MEDIPMTLQETEQPGGRQHYPTRRSMSGSAHDEQPVADYSGHRPYQSSLQHHQNASAANSTPKNVTFELHFEGAPNYRGRLPMRVQIFPHDTTESIVTTVKNFYGLYEGAAKGVSFEDSQGNTLIARYENFLNNMTIYVRVVPDFVKRPELQGPWAYRSASPPKLSMDDALQMLPPQGQILNYGQPPSRPGSRISRKQSASPRLHKGGSFTKSRSRSGLKSHGSSFQAGLDELNSDTINGFSDSDGGAGSVTSSRKARSEQLASAEISVDNIVEGGRRKRAKFESSELPLFVPPQVPAPNSISSVSPQRRTNGQDHFSPFARPTQHTFTYSVPLQSPQSSTFLDHAQAGPSQNSPFAVPSANHTHRLRGHVGASALSNRSSSGTMPRRSGFGVLPTPDPTIASCISDEDVALQLMRLGDASNISHGRTSASTLDDAFSGRAETASSMTSNSDIESDATEQPHLPTSRGHMKIEPDLEAPAALKRHYKHLDDNLPSFDSTEPSGDEVDEDYEDGIMKSDPDDQKAKPKAPKTKITYHKVRGASASTKSSKSSKHAGGGMSKKAKPSTLSSEVHPAQAASVPSRKTSLASTINFQHQLGADEDDLSSKPRCQRCRKSKKGCDRQRPCQRCVDAGIGIEGCISEDEGNGRKGRYGRHMGVPVKKITEANLSENESQTAGAILTGMAAGTGSPEKGKKRKR